ncbi:WXG100 family type VII secretion target [Streptomyces sp. NBC_01381]|uniref:WXG100 family type VII secretion target n=1 Tax=Streptomyces sp. NBC_01381 TaxID=2903845 RepID=UPI0022508F0A|nr:WXG100 family type VII secretion target [Streptomyces sp. NBC_01381]MCX4670414.1 WXG100 family type VII secretion target [Streptomyces sp. NBC_01381]
MANVHYGEMAVKYGGLDAITTELGNQAKQLEADLADIKRAVAKVAEGWEGKAHEAYVLKQKEWDNNVEAIHRALVEIGQKVGQAGGDYRGGDLKGASYFQ